MKTPSRWCPEPLSERVTVQTPDATGTVASTSLPGDGSTILASGGMIAVTGGARGERGGCYFQGHQHRDLGPQDGLAWTWVMRAPRQDGISDLQPKTQAARMETGVL